MESRRFPMNLQVLSDSVEAEQIGAGAMGHEKTQDEFHREGPARPNFPPKVSGWISSCWT